MATSTTRAKGKNGKTDPAIVEFLDTAGHELRGPITAMKGQLQLLQRKLRAQQGRDADLADIARVMFQVERLNHSLEVILEGAHVEQGRLRLMPSTNDLVGVVQRVVTIYSYASRAHTLTLHVPEAPIILSVDRQRIDLVLSVLISNAIKYSAGGEIDVTISTSDDCARVEVSDHGIGVLKEDRGRIFQAYTRGGNVENDGLGLSLYIARAVVSRHGGRMGFRANHPNGSVFWLTLPLHSALHDE